MKTSHCCIVHHRNNIHFMNLVPVQCRIGLAVFKGQNERFPKDVMALFRIIVYSKIQRYDRWITIYNLSRENFTADIKIFGKSVEKVYEFHQLGVTIDDKLNWSRQIEKLCKKLSSALFSIKQIKFLPESSLVTTYRALWSQDCITAMLSGEIVAPLSSRSYNASRTEPYN